MDARGRERGAGRIHSTFSVYYFSQSEFQVFFTLFLVDSFPPIVATTWGPGDFPATGSATNRPLPSLESKTQ